MKSLWEDLISKYSIDIDLIENFYGIIEKKYYSSNILYHNLDHISIMLSEVKKYENRIQKRIQVFFIINKILKTQFRKCSVKIC